MFKEYVIIDTNDNRVVHYGEIFELDILKGFINAHGEHFISMSLDEYHNQKDKGMIKRQADGKEGLGYSVVSLDIDNLGDVLADFTTYEDAERYTEMNSDKRLWITCDCLYVNESIKPLWKLEQEEYKPKHLGDNK